MPFWGRQWNKLSNAAACMKERHCETSTCARLGMAAATQRSKCWFMASEPIYEVAGDIFLELGARRSGSGQEVAARKRLE
jgi:hypothetical protein